MYTFGTSSQLKLDTVVPPLKELVTRALATGVIDFSVVEGRRERERQDQYFSTGLSKVKWPDSKHNVLKPEDLAKAVDLVPYIHGSGLSYARPHCCVLAGIVLAIASMMGLKVRWGGNWDQDGEPVTDQDFQDLVHFELVD